MLNCKLVKSHTDLSCLKVIIKLLPCRPASCARWPRSGSGCQAGELPHKVQNRLEQVFPLVSPVKILQIQYEIYLQ